MGKSPAPILTARSLAIVGATERSHWPANIFANLKASGFAGPVWPVNPRRDEVWGEKCYPDFEALPEVPELALMIIPAGAVEPVLAKGARMGVKSAIVYASGIGEGTDPEVIERGRSLKAMIAAHSIAVCGPNCMGLAAIRERLYLYPHTHLSNMEPGPVGLVFQSGGTLSYFVRTATARGLRFSYTISSGNELDLDLADYIDFLVDDENTHTIVLFIEGIRQPRAFMAAAARALKAEKPIIAIKTGRSAAGRAAALSHSGAVSGDYAVYEAVCERYGIVNCASLDGMIETTLAFQGRRFPDGPNIAFMTTSGGTVDLLHDYVEAEDASMPELAPDTAAAIALLVNDDVAIRNPIDTGSPIGAADISAPMGICKAMANDPGIDMVAWGTNLPATAKAARNPDMVRDLLAATTKPVIAFSRLGDMVSQAGRDYQDETGLFYLHGLEPTVRALGALWFFAARRGRDVAALPDPHGRAEKCSGTALAQALAKSGIPAPQSTNAATPEDAAAAAAAIGFPIALKIVSPGISHKTEIGGVRLDLRSLGEVTDAAQALQAAAQAARPDAAVTGFSVQEMVGGIEMLVGARDDELFGPVIVLGAGGVLVELIADVALRLLPVTEGDVRAMLGELRVMRLLDGFRGAAACDVDALVAAVCALGAFYLDHRIWLADLEINPLMGREKGAGVSAVDLRAVPRDAAESGRNGG